MTDPADTRLFNEVKATLGLIGHAQEWEKVAADESLMDGVRVFAAERARAIREELRCGG